MRGHVRSGVPTYVALSRARVLTRWPRATCALSGAALQRWAFGEVIAASTVAASAAPDAFIVTGARRIGHQTGRHPRAIAGGARGHVEDYAED